MRFCTNVHACVLVCICFISELCSKGVPVCLCVCACACLCVCACAHVRVRRCIGVFLHLAVLSPRASDWNWKVMGSPQGITTVLGTSDWKGGLALRRASLATLAHRNHREEVDSGIGIRLTTRAPRQQTSSNASTKPRLLLLCFSPLVGFFSLW